jgi:hypothetical protein
MRGWSIQGRTIEWCQDGQGADVASPALPFNAPVASGPAAAGGYSVPTPARQLQRCLDVSRADAWLRAAAPYWQADMCIEFLSGAQPGIQLSCSAKERISFRPSQARSTHARAHECPSGGGICSLSVCLPSQRSLAAKPDYHLLHRVASSSC